MASSSSQSWKYDVFLSFRGKDTRKTFVDHLYSAFQQHGILTYKDDVTLDRGDTIGPSLLKAIETSKILVIIFSENYANSSWCLNELSHIMKCYGNLLCPYSIMWNPLMLEIKRGNTEKHLPNTSCQKSKDVNKELFLDIACFYRWRGKHLAKDQLDACGFYPAIGVKVLIQKALLTVSEYDQFDMHDLVQEMAHYIVRGEHPNNPETYSRVWRNKDIKYLCSSNEIMENDKIEAIICHVGGGSFNNFINVVSNMKKLRSLEVNIGLYIDRNGYLASPFPKSFQPRLLCVFTMCGSFQKVLWKGYKDLPCLKVMQLFSMEALVRTPDFGGLPSLQKLILWRCDSLEEIHQSLGSLSSLVHLSVSKCKKLTRFPKIVKMEKLKILKILNCEALTEFPDIEAKMDSLVELTLRGLGIEIMFSVIRKCSYLQNFELKGCQQFEKLPKGIFNENLDGLGLRKLNLNWCHLKDGDIPNEISGLSNLRELHVGANYFTRLDFSLSRLTSLKVLNLSCCRNLVELPELPSSLAILTAEECDSLEVIKDDAYRRCKWLWQVSIKNEMKNISGGERLLESMLQVYIEFVLILLGKGR